MKNPIVVLSIIVGVVFILSLAAAMPQPDYQADMDELQREALDQAFRSHMANLFSVWMREPYPDPNRPVAGADKYRDAYIEVRKALDKRAVQP